MEQNQEFRGIPAEFYKYKTGDQQIQAEGNERWGLDKLDITENGVFTYITSAQFAHKNFVYANPEGQNTLFAANQVKSLFIETIKAFPVWVFIFINKQKLLDAFNRIGFRVASPHILKDKQWSSFARAFHYVIFTFLHRLGFEEKSCDRFAEIFVWMIDCDNAYRLRIEDVFTTTTREELVKNPIKELKKLAKTYQERETNPSVALKFGKLANLVIYLLYIPKYKKAFIEAIRYTDFKDLQLDEADEYWTIIRQDYNFLGMTLSQRKKHAETKGWEMPKPLNI